VEVSIHSPGVAPVEISAGPGVTVGITNSAEGSYSETAERKVETDISGGATQAHASDTDGVVVSVQASPPNGPSEGVAVTAGLAGAVAGSEGGGTVLVEGAGAEVVLSDEVGGKSAVSMTVAALPCVVVVVAEVGLFSSQLTTHGGCGHLYFTTTFCKLHCCQNTKDS